jgi:ferredoxin-NADP reductase/DMSO/TMAO reductase YedYZ heme-binding membrane subunit
MPTSESFLDTRFAKRLAIVNACVPAVLLVWDAWRHQLGVNEVNFAIRTTGLIGLILLTLALAVTPLRVFTGWNRLIAMRRNFGVIGFFYLASHFLIFFLFDRQASVSSTLTEIVTRKYLWFGATALVLMIPLAITSTDRMVQRVGARRWKRLHRLVYVIAIAGVVHYYLLVKSDVRQPLWFAGVIGALLLYRLVAHYLGLRADARAGRTRAHATVGRATPATSKQARSFWSGELVITRIFDETHDVKTFRLAAPDDGPLPFMHVAGQYLNLALTIDGTRVNRSYTIASAPTRSAYCEISVKRVPNGYASHHLHDTWREGQRVKVSAAAGKFVFAGRATDARRIVLIAGGIGITPLMSVVRSLTDRGWMGEMYLLLSVRAVRDYVFADELTYLQSRHPNLHVRVLVSQDPDTPWNGLRGQITRDVIAEFVANLTRGPVMLCGPGPMMTAMRAILVGMGVPNDEVLQEEFVSRPPVESAADADAPSLGAPDVAASGAQVAFTRTGRTIDVLADQSLLEAAEDNGIDLPFECRSGICGQCKTHLRSGRVRMDVQDALSAADRAAGFILACQAHALGNLEVEA